MSLRLYNFHDESITVISSRKGKTNSILVELPGSFILVDSLLLSQDINELCRIISKAEKQSEKNLSLIINTHFHSDHCYGNAKIKRPYTQIIAHENHKKTITSEKTIIKQKKTFRVFKNRISYPDITFSHNMSLLTDETVKILYTPGHTDDSVSIFFPEKRLLLAGDTILNNNPNKLTLPYFYWGNLESYIKTLNTLDKLEIDFIIPGHGDTCTKAVIKKYLHYLRRLRRIFYRLIQSKNILIKKEFFDELSLESILKFAKNTCIDLPEIHYHNIENLYREYCIKKNRITREE